ncbi:S-adenosyl-L-methionine-dependent methyltransferase [Nemania abortiva]|nr:S-adenosyl-L-methionine-dependent methyltransferase [Nemania abortiva]
MEGNTKPAESYDPTVYWLAPAQNFRSSGRLHLQHMLCQNTLGFLLHDHVKRAIPTEPSGVLKVADLACGNGAWLIDLSRKLYKDGVRAELDGFDVNEILFPAPAFRPPWVSLKKLDILAKPLPEELIGAYDIVHVRAFVSVIKHAETTPLLSTVLAMLKPGGWVQWEEMSPNFLIEPSTPTLETSACRILEERLRADGERVGLKFDFLPKLDSHLGENGFEYVSIDKSYKRKEDYKAWTDDFLMVWEELTFRFPPKATMPDATITREFWTEHLVKAIAETEKGVALHAGVIYTAVGHKPVQDLSLPIHTNQ